MEDPSERKEKVRHGMVLVSDGKSRPRPVRLRLTPDTLMLQKEREEPPPTPNMRPNNDAPALALSPEEDAPVDSGLREVCVVRQRTGGLGFSIKGGAEHRLPILVSRIVKGQAADQTGRLFVGDAVLRVNGRVMTNVTHDEAVQILRSAGTEVQLTVKHYRAATPFLQRSPVEREDRQLNNTSQAVTSHLRAEDGWRSPTGMVCASGSLGGEQQQQPMDNERLLPRCSHSSSNECLPGSDPSLSNSSGSVTPSSSHDKKWVDVVTVPLMLAYFTRYIYGTDKLRPNAFEVRGVNGTSTGIIHCDDAASLSQWMKHITDNIVGLTNLQMTLHNRGLPSRERISYMGWVSEGLLSGGPEPWQTWQPRFLALRGSEVYLFEEGAPRCPEDWDSCPRILRLHQSLLRVLKASENVDERQHCFLLQTLQTSSSSSAGAAPPTSSSSELPSPSPDRPSPSPERPSSPQSNQPCSHYLSVETRQELLRLEGAWHRAVCTAVHRLGSKTFSVTSEGRTAGLTLDLGMGFGLYDTQAKTYSWKYKFSQLKGSSDDGKCRLRLHFQDPDTRKVDIRELECSSLQSLLLCMHAFLTAKVACVDPAFLSSSPALQTLAAHRRAH